MKLMVDKRTGPDWQKILAFNGIVLFVMSVVGLFRLDPKVAEWQQNGLWVALCFLSSIGLLFFAIVYHYIRIAYKLLKRHFRQQSYEKHSVHA